MSSIAAALVPDAETLVIGAGLAGLSCAVRLHEAGHRVRVLEGFRRGRRLDFRHQSGKMDTPARH